MAVFSYLLWCNNNKYSDISNVIMKNINSGKHVLFSVEFLSHHHLHKLMILP